MRQMRISIWLKFLICILAICLLIIPKIITFANEATDAFLYSSIAVAQASYEQNRILINPFKLPESYGAVAPWQSHANRISERVAVTSFLIAFSQVTGLKMRELLFLPIGGLIIILFAYALGKTFSKSQIIAILYALFISYSYNNNSMFYIPLGLATHYAFLIILIKVTEFRTNIRTSIALLSIIFVTSYLTYYSAEVFNLASIAFITLLIILAKRKTFKMKLQQHLPSFVYLTLTFAIMFLMFESEFFIYLRTASLERFWNTLVNYLSYVYDVLKGNVSQIQEFRSFFGNIAAIYIDLVTRVLIISVTVAYALYHIAYCLKNSTTIKINTELTVFFSLVAVSILELLIYWSYGPAGGFRYVYWFVSLTALYSLNKFSTKLNKKKLFLFISLVIVFTVVLKFAIIWQDPVYSYDGRHYYTLLTPTATWVMKNVEKHNILSDFHISGRLLAEAAFYSKANSLYVYKFSEDLDILYEANQSKVDGVFRERGYGYIVLSSAFRHQAVIGDIWAPQGPPLGNALSFFDDYTSFNKIYDDNRGLVYKYQK